MGLLDEGTDREYYQEGDHGNYQFTTLDDIITQFQIAYVGEDKIISKIRRADIAFHAQRALQELSFDTLKSVKAQEIILPPSLVMTLPRDYVNYTKISTVDQSGIKHLLYPTSLTSNPFSIKQLPDGKYNFLTDEELLSNPNFSEDLEGTWQFTPKASANSGAWWNAEISGGDPDNVDSEGFSDPIPAVGKVIYRKDDLSVSSGKLQFNSLWHKFGNLDGFGREYGVWQEVDVSNYDHVTLSANGRSANEIKDNVDTACGFGILRIGLSSKSPQDYAQELGSSRVQASTPKAAFATTGNINFSVHQVGGLDLGYVEWSDGSTSTKELIEVNVSRYNKVWVWIQSKSPWTPYARRTAATIAGAAEALAAAQVIDSTIVTLGGTTKNNRNYNVAPGYANQLPFPLQSIFAQHSTNIVNSVTLTTSTEPESIRHAQGNKNSTTKARNQASGSQTLSNHGKDDAYWPLEGSRYGLDPQIAQGNGSFYIDNRLGKVTFSSNIAGNTVILDYISDSLGTDDEMQVHKFAEEAMYKCIAHAILSTRANTQEYLVQRFKKERFAAIRTAKLRLSNIKLEELTQILRGKSKQIKH